MSTGKRRDARMSNDPLCTILHRFSHKAEPTLSTTSKDVRLKSGVIATVTRMSPHSDVVLRKNLNSRLKFEMCCGENTTDGPLHSTWAFAAQALLLPKRCCCPSVVAAQALLLAISV
ncbi:hypothetical protein LSAT2_027686 [Lamellibrachia satsuma]|nr:hypothetical protein LSAT2_027686 [Lamellibrachia satsuma]